MPHLTVDEFRSELKVRGFDGFSAAEIDRYLDWGYAHVSRLCRWSWEEATLNFSVDPGIAWMDLLTDFPEFGSLRALLTTTPERYQLAPMADEEYFGTWGSRSEEDLQDPANRGASDQYYVVRNRIYFIPPPQMPMTFVAHYWRRVVDFVASGGIVAPFDLDEAILAAAEMICHRRMREYEHMDRAEATLNDVLGDFISEDNLRVDEEEERVIPEVWR